MSRLFSVLCLMLTIAMATGCEPESATSSSPTGEPRVAVVDLQRLIQESGEADRIQSGMTQATEQARQELDRRRNSFQNAIAERQAEFGETPTAEQTRQLQTMQAQANAQVQQFVQQVDAQFGAARSQQIEAFRSLTAPIIQQVASQGTYDLVVYLNPNIVSFNPAADLTAAVLEQLKTDPRFTGGPAGQDTNLAPPMGRMPGPGAPPAPNVPTPPSQPTQPLKPAPDQSSAPSTPTPSSPPASGELFPMNQPPATDGASMEDKAAAASDAVDAADEVVEAAADAATDATGATTGATTTDDEAVSDDADDAVDDMD